MNSLPEAERDAGDVVRALAGLAALAYDGELSGEEARRAVDLLIESGTVAAAARVLSYLRATRGPGDGVAVAVPARLGPWRDWVPARGHLTGTAAWTPRPRIGELPQRRRADPGE